MGKAKKKTAISKKEEQQAQKVVKIVFVSLIIFGWLIHYRLHRLHKGHEKKVCPDGENHVICGEFLFCNAFVTPVISM